MTNQETEKKIVIDENTKLKMNESFVLREIGGEVVIIPTDDTSLIGNGMLSPNETGAFIWKQFSEARTIPEVIQNCMKEYDGTEEEITQAVVSFVQQSLQLKMMEME